LFFRHAVPLFGETQCGIVTNKAFPGATTVLIYARPAPGLGVFRYTEPDSEKRAIRDFARGKRAARYAASFWITQA
jgi:hypothetical protein